ncbi:putative ABC transport system permease protein [Desulfurobacterium pacificum]|uniref:ABC transport system permease protein n=1 Tax=Desulfurobacterium pacificum TaxID=240166 RepID=A0ABY1N8U8_9BACT|nr:ABC transporter permease [Desulfurobacterium pacificum]SMP02865.1 putative ABC transport system permease protein [Desulfurobacterium pacificum]
MNVNALFSYFRENKKRMVLSVIGVAIGVFALTLMTGITGAMKRSISKALGSMGANLIVVIPGEVKNFGGRTLQLSFYPTLTLKDAKAIKEKCPSVRDVAPYKLVNPNVHYGGKSISSDVVGTTPSYEIVTDFHPFCGRFITQDDVENISQVAVIGYEVAKELYGETCPVGKTVYLYNAPYKIVGVMEKRGTDLSGEDLDTRIFIPITSAVKRISNVDYIDGIYVLSVSPSMVRETIKEVKTLLLKRHGKKDFTVDRYEDVVNTKKQALAIFSKLSIIVATISFGVGALGILAVMTLSVYERLIEIGVRRAFGASKKHILVQFLIESIILSFSGAIPGIALAILLVLLVSKVAGWVAYIPIDGAVISFSLSLVIGLVAGVYPALRATSFDPKEILKEE